MSRRLITVLAVCLWVQLPVALAQGRIGRPTGPIKLPVAAPTGVINGTLTPVASVGPAPASLTITGTTTTASLSWASVPGAGGYRVYRQVAPSGNWTALTPTPVTAVSYGDLSGLDYRQGYLYRVVATFPAGDGAAIDRPYQPPAPVNPTGVNAVQNGTSVVVSWAPVPGVSYYMVFGQTAADARQVPATQSSVTYTAVTPGPHSWAVGSYYLPGPMSSPGTDWAKAALPVTPAVDFVGGASASVLGTRVDMYFMPVPNATSYSLLRATAAAGPYTPVAAKDTWVFQVTCNNRPCWDISDMQAYKLGAGIPLWYQVVPMSGTTPLFTSQPIRADLPSWFKGPMRIDVVKTGADQWTVGWEHFPEATGYSVLVTSNSHLVTLYSNQSIAPGTMQVNVSGLQSGQRYFIEVKGQLMYMGPQNQVRPNSMWYTAP